MALGPRALLALEDGSFFRGVACGAAGEAFGEAVFNTSMGGYQEVLTDPSYAGQIVVMTAPHQGNYGVNSEDPESSNVQVVGFVMREASRLSSGWRAQRSLQEELAEAGVVAVEGADTRRLTLRLREHGVMRSGISTEDLDPASLVERVRRQPGMAGADLARGVSARRPYEAREAVGSAERSLGPVFRVAAFDFGIKRSILALLARAGCETTVLPAETAPEVVLTGGFDGAVLSNGPGDPAATGYGIRAARRLLGRLPLFGICLGHQLLGLALEGRTYKMKYGHRGSNQPVKDLTTGRVQITSHNHGFAVDPRPWGPSALTSAARAAEPPIVETRVGRVALTHWNLNDGTLEGLRCLDVPAHSVQFHPEAAPGPHDAGHLFLEFRRLMAGAGDA